MTATNHNAIKRLSARDFEARIDAMTELREQKDTGAIPALLTLLRSDPDFRIREEAAYSLESIGDTSAVPYLVTTLSDRHGNVRLKAARALGTLRDGTAVEPLCTSLRDPDQVVRAFAAYALGKIGDTQAIRPLEHALANTTHPEARQAIERVLADFRKALPVREVKFECPACTQRIACPESLQGTQLQCPVCGHPLTVPAPAARPAAASQQGGAVPLAVPARQRPPGSAAQGTSPGQVLFSFTGRIGRGTFWGAWIGMMVVSLVAGLVIGAVASTAGQATGLVLYLLFLIPAVYAGLSIQIKRWHDIGVSGWILMLAIIPFVNLLYLLVAIVCLGCVKGATGPNKYGPNPLEPKAPTSTPPPQPAAPQPIAPVAPPPLPAQAESPPSPSEATAPSKISPTVTELESLFVGKMRLLGVLAGLIGTVLAVVAICFFSGALSLPSSTAAGDARTLMFVAFCVALLYLAACVGAFRRAPWAIYTLFVLGYLSLVNSVIEMISGNGMAAFVGLVSLQLVRVAHGASGQRKQVRQAKAAVPVQQLADRSIAAP